MKDMTWQRAVETVLGDSEKPLHYREITERILGRGLKKKVGATPAATVSAVLNVAVKKADSPFEKIERAVFRLRNAPPATAETDTTADEAAPVITSFGLYWDRAAVGWTRKPSIYGEYQTDGAARSSLTRVNFGEQHGIYLLHDAREVIYVGRTTKGALGKRLSDHTRDRLRGRWTHFSWFGFRPVAEDGTLGEKLSDLPADFDMEKLIGAFEAILIEALEPRQNRKQGDEFGDIEYRQVLDPTVEKKRLQKAIADYME